MPVFEAVGAVTRRSCPSAGATCDEQDRPGGNGRLRSAQPSSTLTSMVRPPGVSEGRSPSVAHGCNENGSVATQKRPVYIPSSPIRFSNSSSILEDGGS